MIDLEKQIEYEKQAESAKERGDEKEYKGRLGKLFVRLRDFTGNEQTAKMILGLIIFAVGLIFLLIIASIIRPRRPREPISLAPTPTPTPLPLPLQPTPTPFILEAGSVAELIQDLEAFDIEQKDLLPPKVDLEINL